MYMFEMLIESGSITVETDDMAVINAIQAMAAYCEEHGWEVVEEDDEEVEADEEEYEEEEYEEEAA